MSVTVNTNYDEAVTRWEPDGRGRLALAALDLFGEQGFDDTTVAEIAERAGLTERTFFRHFTDKRDVLFSGSEELRDLFVEAVSAAPASSSPIEAAFMALDQAGALLISFEAIFVTRHSVKT